MDILYESTWPKLKFWDLLKIAVVVGFIGGWIFGMFLGLWTQVTLGWL